MGVLVGLAAAFAASFVAFLVMITPLVYMGLDNYHGPGSTGLVYGMVGVILAVFMFTFQSGKKRWAERKSRAGQ